jgi:hypothetical protein
MPTEMLLPENAIEIIRGTSKTLELLVVDEDGVAVDLTNGAIVFSVKKRTDDVLPLIQKKSTVPAEAEIVAPREGRARIYLIPADTQNLEVMPYVFDCWLLLTGKRYAVVPPSTFLVLAGVTFLPL